MPELTLTPAQTKCLLAVKHTLGSVGRTRIVDVAGLMYPPKERTARAQMNGGAAASSYNRNTAKMLERLGELGLVWVEFGVGVNRWYELTPLGKEVADGLASAT